MTVENPLFMCPTDTHAGVFEPERTTARATRTNGAEGGDWIARRIETFKDRRA